MRILITGAHFTPAVAVIDEFKKMDPGVKIVYVGRRTTQEGDETKSVESQILPNLGVKFIPIIAGRLQRSFSIYTIPSLFKIPVGFLQAIYIVLSQKPDVILSFGGYIAVPVVIAGWLFSIPIIIHEQTLVSGLANKISSLFADKIAISFKENKDFNSNKTILTGNPIRDNLRQGAKVTHLRGGLPTILITGGNQGSHIINQTIEGILDKLTEVANIIHVTGDNKFHDFERLQVKQNQHYIVKKWIGEQWGETLSRADIVISRAGINTLSEMAYLGKPGLVIPLPYLYKNEQNENAKFFEKLGLVKILPQSQLSTNSLLISIKEMLSDLVNLKQKAKEAKKIIIPDAAKRLVLETLLLVK